VERVLPEDSVSLKELKAKLRDLKGQVEAKYKMLTDLVDSVALVPEKADEAKTTETPIVTEERDTNTEAPKAESESEAGGGGADTVSTPSVNLEEQRDKLLSEIDFLKKEIEMMSEIARNFVDNKLPSVRKMVWAVISFNVCPEEGRMTTYINGRKCHEANGLDPSELRLQHKLVVFGGGKLAHSQGGDIRRLIVQGAECTDSQVYDNILRTMASSSLITEYISKIQARIRGHIQRLKFSKSSSVVIASDRTREISASEPQFKVSVKFLNGRSINFTVQGDYTFRRMKEIITDMEGIPTEKIVLIHAFKNVGEEETRTLSDFGITKDMNTSFSCFIRSN
jgi:hypothetical protein